MFAIVGALAIALAALTMLCAAILARHPAVPAVLKGDTVAISMALLVTAFFSVGVTVMVIYAQQTGLWQFATAGVIVCAAAVLAIAVFRRLEPLWQTEPPEAPVVEFPGQRKPAGRTAAKKRAGYRRAA